MLPARWLQALLLALQRAVVGFLLFVCRPFWSPLPGKDADRLWELLHFSPLLPDPAAQAACADLDDALCAPPSAAACSSSSRIWRGVDPLLAMRKKRLTLVLDLDQTLACTVAAAAYHRSLAASSARKGAGALRAPDGSFDVRRPDGRGEPTTYLVWRRPHLDLFLREVARWFRVVVFTAGRKEYADPLCDFLDPHCVIRRRLYRGSCKAYQHTGAVGGGGGAAAAGRTAARVRPAAHASSPGASAGSDLSSSGSPTFFVKDLSIVSDDLSKVLLLDDSPGTPLSVRAAATAAAAAAAAAAVLLCCN